LAVNVDVANGTFWTAQDLHQAIRNLIGLRHPRRGQSHTYETLRDQLAPRQYNNKYTQTEEFKTLRIMQKLKFKVKFYAKTDKRAAEKLHTIKKFAFDEKMPHGVNAKSYIFRFKDKQTNKEEDISVYNYFKRKYGVDLQYWYLPLVETERDGMFPMEACMLAPFQKYQYKLSPEQASSLPLLREHP
jgi:eukaryotic translation initiation factor 2C